MEKASGNQEIFTDKHIFNWGLEGWAGTYHFKKNEGHPNKIYSGLKGMRRCERPWAIEPIGINQSY